MWRLGWGFHKKLQNKKTFSILYTKFKEMLPALAPSPHRPTTHNHTLIPFQPPLQTRCEQSGPCRSK